MDDNEPLYDEFGNYLGDLESDESESDWDSLDEDEEEEEQGPMAEPEDDDRMVIADLEQITAPSAVVLYEDKQYYEDNEAIFPEAEIRIQEEDTQPLEKPIFQPIKDKVHELIEKEKPSTSFNFDFMGHLMESPFLIRNIVIVGHLHHGKTTFVDMLVKETHHKKWDLDKGLRYTDKRKDEQNRGLSIKATPMSFVLSDLREKSHLINVMDCPGHVNFSDEMTAGMRLADGAMVLIDALEGVMLNTERSIKHAVRHGLKICLCVNKIDRLILELRIPPEDCYLKLQHTINQVNKILEECGSDQFVSPLKGNVIFASAMYGWSFTLLSFAEIYCHYHPGTPVKAFAKRLWGDVYFDKTTRRFKRIPTSENSDRTFIQFILDPVYKIYSHVVGGNPEDLGPLLEQIDVRLNKTELNLNPHPLMYTILSRFFSHSRGFVQMCVDHFPSPVDGNAKVVETNYTGDLTTEVAIGMKRCDPRAPLMLNVTKMYPRPDASGFDSFGRVFSGTLRVGQQVSVLREGFTTDDEDMSVKEITNIWVYNGRYRVEMNQVTAGNWCLIGGIDSGINKTATVCDAGITQQSRDEQPHIFRPLKFNTISTLKVSVEPVKPAELPKMIDGLRAINKSYPLCVTKREESGEHVLLGTGELYLDCLLVDLREMYSEIEVKVSDPVVQFCETVIDTSQMACFAETPNRKNKLTMICEPLDEKQLIAEDIEDEVVKIDWEPKMLGKFFKDKYGWDLLAARNIWAFGPENNGPNILIDDTLPSEIDKEELNLIRNSVVQGFQWGCDAGPLCGEPIRNCRFKLIEAEIDPEPINRSGIQIIPTARRVLYSSFLLASPRLMEPVFDCQIQCPADCKSAIHQVCKARRAHVHAERRKPGAPFDIFHVQIPAIDSYGFETDIRAHTQGQAFCLSVFDHWELVQGDPMKEVPLIPLRPSQPNALAYEFMLKTRRRKGLAAEVSIDKYIDEEMLDALAQHEFDRFQNDMAT